MKTLNKKVFVLAGALTVAFFLQTCKKDQALLPQTATNELSTTLNQIGSLASVSELYEVTTLVKGTSLNHPLRLCSAANGMLYASSPVNDKIYGITQAGVISTKAILPAHSNIVGLKAGESGTVYAALVITNSIVKVDKNNHVTNIPVSIGLNHPVDLAIGPDSTLYIADTDNHRIVKLTRNGTATILAGKTGICGNADGTCANARFNNITNIRYAADNTLWVIDSNSPSSSFGQKLRKVTLNGTVTTFYRLGPSEGNVSISDFAVAKRGKEFNATGKENFFLGKKLFDSKAGQLNMVSHLSDTGIETVISPYSKGYMDGTGGQAQFFDVGGITVKPYGIFIADVTNFAIRVIKRRL
ncbi:MAG: hypothetical protein JWP67_2572 [Mucilaginibacter sp.]|nr:hypothetical protein [Mucilaginibacter sp.]